jgi:hypothetical protein
LEGVGIRTHDNRWCRDIWGPSGLVYYILGVGESTPTVVFNLQAALYRVLASCWRQVVALFVRVVLARSSQYISRKTVIPADVLALWNEGGTARGVAKAMGTTVNDALSFSLFVQRLVVEGKLFPSVSYPLPRRTLCGGGDDDGDDVEVRNCRSSGSWGRDDPDDYDEEQPTAGSLALPYLSDDEESDEDVPVEKPLI